MKRALIGRALVRLCLVLALAEVASSAAAQNIIIEPPDPVVCPDGRQCTASQLCQRVAGTSSFTCISASACPAASACDPECCLFGTECVAGTCPLPDLSVDATKLQPVIRVRSFSPAACELRAEEGPCIGAPGNRRLLAFTTFTPNLGEGALFLGDPAENPGVFHFSSCHNHYHFNSYAKYELLDVGGNLVADGGKRAFCLIDLEKVDPTAGPDRFDCDFQGIARGWADEYDDGLSCQWIDVTNVPPGNYLLQVRLNFEQLLAETDFSNNGAQMAVTIPPLPCNFSLFPTSINFPAQGGGGTVNVGLDVDSTLCTWTAASNDPWLTITGGASGSGPGTVFYAVAATDAGIPRAGTLTIAGHTFTVTQAAGACTYSLSPTSGHVTGSGGSGSVTVTAPTGCPWTARSDVPWMGVISGASGTGTGTVQYLVESSTEPADRTGTLTIAGLSFPVAQDAGVCAFVLSPSSVSVSYKSNSGAVTVNAGTGCGWTAHSNDSWITILTGASGSGTGNVGYSIAANPGPTSRTGTVTIGDQTFTVFQTAPPVCNFSLSPASASFGHSGGTGSFKVYVGADCSWTATSNVSWLHVTAGSPGIANGTVSYSVDVNGPKVSRTGTITVGGLQLTVTQAP
jgi:lysyl oxidase/BACON domain-containing protein/all-beta uncharacterized protein